MHKRHYLLLCCGLLLIAAQALMAQNYSVPLRFNDGSSAGYDTLTIGVNAAATSGLDPALGEEELPPSPPDGVFGARIVTLGGASGQRIDFHPTTAGVPDTFIVKFQSNTEAGATGMTISWDGNISTKGAGGWRLVDNVGGVVFNVNMNGQSSYTIPLVGPYASPQLRASGLNEALVITEDAGAFRSFNASDVALSVDAKGKSKSTKKKPVASECTFTFAVPAGATTALVKLGQVATYAVSQTAGWSAPAGLGTKAVTYTWGGVGTPPATLEINIGGNKGKANKAKAEFNTAPKVTKVTGTLTNARLLLPFPNLWNWEEEIYAGAAFGANGLEAGVSGNPKSVIHPKANAVLKTLNKKGVLHTGAAKCLDNFASGKPILKVQKSLPPDKHNNMLLAEQVALKLNVASSDKGHTTAGYGDLVYVDAGNVDLDNKSIRQLMVLADQVLSCDTLAPVTPAEIYTAVSNVNNAFRATLDTAAWDAGGKLVWTSVVPISSAPFLKRVSGAAPVNYTGKVIESVPSNYALGQNYPNPFNPTTTIEFTLAEDAIVTLKVYNVLGQEVATLASNEEMLEGSNSVEFDASGLPSGIYYYRLTVNDGQFTAVNKMMLMK